MTSNSFKKGFTMTVLKQRFLNDGIKSLKRFLNDGSKKFYNNGIKTDSKSSKMMILKV